MRKKYGQLTALSIAWATFATLLPAASALEPIPWQTDFNQARQQAQQTNRLLLLHFWSPDCGPCRALESRVFNQPGFAQALSVHYVPVKVNVYEQPQLAQAYRVQQYPTEVVVGLDGREINRFVAPANPATYLATVTQIARANPAVLKPFAAGPATAPSAAAAQPPLPTGQAPPQMGMPQQTAQGVPAVAHGVGPAAQMGAYPPQQPAMVASPAQPAGPLPLGLDGYCPVRLCENHNWVKGNPQYGVNHRGRLYLFTGPSEQQKFWQNPDRYAPVGGGDDPVLAVDQGLRAPGKREFGMFHGHRVFLFSSEESLQRFNKDPSRYAAGVELQAQRPTASQY